MKFALVRRGYSPSGGAERYLLRFADALRDAGHQPLLIASPQWPAEAWNGERITLQADGPRAFADALRKVDPRSHCDLVFSLERVWDCDAYRAGDGVHRAWLDRRRLFEAPWRSWFRSLQSRHREILELERAVFDPNAASRIIIANSRMVADEITRFFGVPPGRIRVIYNGLPPARDTADRRAATRQSLGLAESDFAILFAGSGWERKGLRFAIEAVNRTRDAQLLVAGAGKRNALPSSAHTRFLGEVTGIRDLMEAADLFLLPTIYDPFSNACLEAMAAGLPVITTQANGFAEVMRPGLDGEALPNPADIPALAAAIEKWRALETPATRASRREEARRHTIVENVRQTLAALTTPPHGS